MKKYFSLKKKNILCSFFNRSFLKPQHADPEEAVTIHGDIKAQNSVGIHWGTFTLTLEVRKVELAYECAVKNFYGV